MKSHYCCSQLVLVVLLKATFALQGAPLSIKDILPEGYNKMRPPKEGGNPAIVNFQVTIMGLDSINEGSMTYTIDIFFAQDWRDHRLRLPHNMTKNYIQLEVDWLKSMWHPDSIFKNAKSVKLETVTIPNHYLWLYQNKTIHYIVKLTLSVSCDMFFMMYPHDTQHCKLKMESLSHTTDDLIFRWNPDDPFILDEDIELPQLALVDCFTKNCTHQYADGYFTCLEIIFKLKRRLGFFMFHTYIPTCLTVIMSWISFWIKPEAAPARVTLGVTSLLTLATQHARSQSTLPPVSYLKAVDIFMSTCTVFVFSALMEYCLVNVLLGDSDGPDPAHSMKKDIKLEMGKENLLTGAPEVPPHCTGAQNARDKAIKIDRFSRMFFPIFFILLNCLYWVMVYYVLEPTDCAKS